MRWLFIDTTIAGTCRFGLLDLKGNGVSSHVARSSMLLPLLSRRCGLPRLRTVEGICVVAGPGSFSSVRGGVLVANLLGRLLNRPLVGVTCKEASDLPSLARRLHVNEIPAQSFIAPIYDAEPNITFPSSVKN